MRETKLCCQAETLVYQPNITGKKVVVASCLLATHIRPRLEERRAMKAT